VASLVAELTDDKSVLKQVRKDKQIAGESHKSDGASVIKVADKTSNLLAIAKSPPPWPPDRKRAYVEWARAVVSGLPLKPTGLMARFEEAARLAMESIER
jgi:GTP diphosphokinase / guanosine-3',5'-bis(diphosphate) 3'-diphosphatase